MPVVLCRLPNHVGDCCMCLPALRLLSASGFTPALVGKRWAEDLLAGMGWRFDPIEGKVSEDLSRIFNFKYPYEYISRFSELKERKDGILKFYEKYPANNK